MKRRRKLYERIYEIQCAHEKACGCDARAYSSEWATRCTVRDALMRAWMEALHASIAEDVLPALFDGIRAACVAGEVLSLAKALDEAAERLENARDEGART